MSMAAIQHQQNQLLFTLDAHSNGPNFSSKFHRPEAIVFEKQAKDPVSNGLQPSPDAFQFSTISEENLSVCMQLAKRDLKKHKEEEERLQLRKQVEKDKIKAGARPKSSTTVRERGLPSKQASRYGSRAPGHSASTAIRRRNETSPPPNRRIQPEILQMPVTSMSPPTRDNDPMRKAQIQDEKTTQEIQKLRREIQYCIEQIKKISHNAGKGLGPQGWEPLGVEDLPEAEVQRKQAARREEYCARFSRMLYDLQHQVKDIHSELERLTSGPVPSQKRSRLLGRIAAAHRSAVRAFQTFLSQIPDYQLQTYGMPKMYQELNLVVKQLSLCCARVELAGESKVPDSVITLLKDVAELNDMMKKEIHHSPERIGVIPPRGKHKSPTSRKLFEDVQVDNRDEPPRGNVKRELLRQGSNDTRVPGGKSNTDKENNSPATPDRQAVLQAGVAALLRAAQEPPTSSHISYRSASTKTKRPAGVPPLDIPKSTSVKQHPVLKQPAWRPPQTWDIPMKPPAFMTKKNGLHFKPHQKQHKLKFQARKKVATKPKPKPVCRPIEEAHFAEPTLSSRMKEMAPQEREALALKSPRSPKSPGRSILKSPGRRDVGYIHPLDSPFDAAAREITRQVLLERDVAREGQRKSPVPKSPRTPRSPYQTRGFDPIIDDAERKIRSRLQPLLDEAKDIMDNYESLQTYHRSSLRSRLTETAVQSVEMNADTMADGLLHEVVEDTARELHRLQQDGATEEQAMDLLNLPKVADMLTRLDQMENEQDEIRRRWATLTYEDQHDFPLRSTYFDAPNNDQPATPPPIEVTHVNRMAQSIPQEYRQCGDDAGSQIIAFTNPKTKMPISNLHLSKSRLGSGDPDDEERAGSTHKPRPIRLFLPAQTLSNIHNYREHFDTHLKKMSMQAVGRFDPWQIVDEIAEEVTSHCLQDVARELEDINNDIINHIYQSEFTKVPSKTALSESFTEVTCEGKTEPSAAAKVTKSDDEKSELARHSSHSDKESVKSYSSFSSPGASER